MVPGPQPSQDAAPSSPPVDSPALQSVQTAAPPTEKVPAAQAPSQAGAPGDACAKPGGQSRHARLPAAGWKVPGAQAEQLVAPAAA